MVIRKNHLIYMIALLFLFSAPRTADAIRINIEGGNINNAQIGNITPSTVKTTTLVTTSAATIQADMTFDDDIDLKFGTDADYGINYDSGTSQLYFSTAETGASMTDANPIFVLRANSGGGTLDDEQRVFGILDYTTSLFYVDQDGDVVATGEVTAVGFNSSAADGYHYLNVGNTSTPSYTPAEGDMSWNKTADHMLEYDGTNQVVIAKKTQTKSFVISAIAATDDFPFWQTKEKIVITAISAVCTGGTNVIGALDEYNATGTSVDAVVDTDWTITTSEYTDSSFTNDTLDAGDWLGWHTTSVSGTVNFLSVTIEYYETY